MTVHVYRFENTTPPHNKYYDIQYDDTARTVALNWGRINGAAGKGDQFVCASRAEAESIVRERIDLRLKRGYKQVSYGTFQDDQAAYRLDLTDLLRI